MVGIGPMELGILCIGMLLVLALLFGIGLVLVRSSRGPGRQVAAGEGRVACPHCGERIYPDTKFCPNCGRELGEPREP